MAYRTLEVTLVSAKGLKDVNLFFKMAVYAVVSLSSDPRVQQRTPPDSEGGRNPTWNSSVRFTILADGELARGQFLNILLRTERFLGDRNVGEVRVPLTELLAGASDGPRSTQFVSYQVRRAASGKPKGVLNFSYRLSERVNATAPTTAAAPAHAAYPPLVAAYPYPPPSASKADEPVMAYPVVPSAAAYPAYGAPLPYPPPAGYQQPPPYGYGYPPAGYGCGYGAAPVVQPQRKNNNFGMGLGAGLLGGALGGLLIGDMISDASAYDAGFGDGGGFGF